MMVDGGWRVWASFCRREDAIYTEWKARGGEFRTLCICNHSVIDHGGLRVKCRRLPRSICRDGMQGQ